MAITTKPGRHAKGVNLLGLIKFLRARRRTQPLTGLSAELEAVLDTRILLSSWYPLEHVQGLLEYTYQTVLGQRAEAALAMGVAGGKEVWEGPHRAFLAGGDPTRSLRHMVVAWQNYFDFGSVVFEPLDATTLRFAVHGYPDVPVVHGMTIAGWHLAAAQLGGWPNATAEVIERPWAGGQRQVHIIRR